MVSWSYFSQYLWNTFLNTHSNYIFCKDFYHVTPYLSIRYNIYTCIYLVFHSKF